MEKLTQSKILNNAARAAAMIIICAAAFIGIFVYKADVTSLLIFISFLLIYVFLPGVLVISNLGIRSDHISTYLVRCFFTGFALEIILYYLNAITGADVILLVAGPLLSVLLIVQLVRRSRGTGSVDGGMLVNAPGGILGILRRTPASFWLFFALVFLYSMLTTQLVYISPELGSYSYIKIDFAYHAGIVNALADNYPPHDPWVNGFSIYYHFFTEMLMSIPARLFGLAPEKMILSGTPYLVAPVLSTALYSFFREFAGRKDRAGLYCLAFHLSNMFLLKEFPRSWFLYHIYSNYDNAGLGIACLLTVMPLIRTWDKKAGFATKEMFLYALLIMLMTGIKGPVAIVLIGGLIGTFLLGLIMRKVSTGTAGMTLMSVIAFTLIYVFVLGSQHSNTSGGSIFNLGEVTDIFFLKEEIMDMFGGSRLVALAVLFGAFTVIFFMGFLLPFIVGYIRELCLVLTKRRDFVFSRVTVYAMALVGFLGMMLLDFSGHSQVYFGFTAAVMVPLIVFWYFEDIEGRNDFGSGFIRGFFIVCLCLSACTSVLCTCDQIGSAQKAYANRDAGKHPYQNVSAAEYEGLSWIRDNTKRDAMIASDRYFSVAPEEYAVDQRSHNTHFAYAVYSQRDQYLEGSGFSMDLDDIELRLDMIRTNRSLYDPENAERGDLARELGVDYVVVSKRFNPAVDLANEDYELCFSNSEMDIYEVNQ